MRADHFGRRARGKGIGPREQLVQRDAERVEIGGGVGCRAFQHLRRRVLEAAARDRFASRQAEIHEERPPRSVRTGEHGVLRLYVAVDDPAAVQVAERASDPGDVPHHHCFGAASYGGEILRAVLEREGCSSCLVPEGDGPRQMWMRQRRRSAVLRREPLGRAELERDLLAGEEVDGEMNGRLRAGPPQPEHLVAMTDRSLLRFGDRWFDLHGRPGRRGRRSLTTVTRRSKRPGCSACATCSSAFKAPRQMAQQMTASRSVSDGVRRWDCSFDTTARRAA